MAPVGYTFNANRPVYRSREQGGKLRRTIIFATLTIAFALALYFWTGTEKEEKNTEKRTQRHVPAPVKTAVIPPLAADKAQAPAVKKPAKDKAGTETAVSAMSFPQMESMLRKAETAYANEKYDKVRAYCYQILDSRKLPDEHPLWAKTVDILGKANVKILFTDYPFPEKKVDYHVRPNDGLRRIAMAHNTSTETVQRGNNMKITDYNVRLGQTFNIYVGDWKIIISKSRRKLYLFDGKKLFKVYNVGIGKQGRTPTGIFKTGGKRRKPDWYSPKGKIPYGDKANVLGTRWIRLNAAGKTSRPVSGLGIHGTWEPDSVGKAESNGCLRLLNNDVEELFVIIPNERKPVPVRIIE